MCYLIFVLHMEHLIFGCFPVLNNVSPLRLGRCSVCLGKVTWPVHVQSKMVRTLFMACIRVTGRPKTSKTCQYLLLVCFLVYTIKSNCIILRNIDYFVSFPKIFKFNKKKCYSPTLILFVHHILVKNKQAVESYHEQKWSKQTFYILVGMSPQNIFLIQWNPNVSNTKVFKGMVNVYQQNHQEGLIGIEDIVNTLHNVIQTKDSRKTIFKTQIY